MLNAFFLFCVVFIISVTIFVVAITIAGGLGGAVVENDAEVVVFTTLVSAFQLGGSGGQFCRNWIIVKDLALPYNAQDQSLE